MHNTHIAHIHTALLKHSPGPKATSTTHKAPTDTQTKANNMSDLDVDSIIDKLLDVKSSRPGKQVNLTEGEIKGLCKASREVFMSQPILLELEAPIKICGKCVPLPWF